MCEIHSELTINTSKQHQLCWLGIIIVNFEQISQTQDVSIADFRQVNAGHEGTAVGATDS